MTTDQDPKLEIIPSQHPVDAIVRAIVAGAEFARRVFVQTEDYEMPPEEDRKNFESAQTVIDNCIALTRRLDDAGWLEAWEKRNGKPGIVMTIEGLGEDLARISAKPGKVESKSSDIRFPGPWLFYVTPIEDMKSLVKQDGLTAEDLEIGTSETDPGGCKIRALSVKGAEWVFKHL